MYTVHVHILYIYWLGAEERIYCMFLMDICSFDDFFRRRIH